MENKDLSNSVIFSKGELLPEQFRKNFIGQTYLNMIVPSTSPLGCPIGNVTFAPGSRNNWHKHPGGQILLVTGGRGWYQEEGKAARELHAGDVVEIPSNVKHWHGAAKDSWFVHIAIEANAKAGPAEWMEPVTDEEYFKLK
ncbi:MAG TPA: cupin domain-containing protein [Anaerolineaceae bacterium]|nr:cupin domain-containing protein [Anaerolineaceae bacterium]